MEEGKKMVPFPFEFAIKKEGKPLFLQTVETVLKEDLQNENSFGCKIHNCHTHVGSERHLKEFIEAELLFHNSYYNKGFAVLTAQKIMNWMESHNDCNKILLVGYENFSELYLCETTDVLRNAKHGDQDRWSGAEYCVYENMGDRDELHKFNELVRRNFVDDHTAIIFIVSISTTFTTLQKVTLAFRGELKKYGINVGNLNNSISMNLALIVIGQEDKVYWKKKEEGTLQLTDEMFPDVDNREVSYFSLIEEKWFPLSECPLCFPDLNNGMLNEESPIFGVNRASVVPMLQLEKKRLGEPFPDTLVEKSREDIKKIIRLSRYMHHKHLERNGNHFQYYFDTELYFISERESVKKWLKNVVEPVINLEPYGNDTKQQEISAPLSERIIYDFLVAPRHFSNAGFVHDVNDDVFHGTARIFYFDVQREYRGNINAKYSDFQRYVTNIKNSKKKSLIRFHFVDDTIYLSNNFQRAKSLISTLTGESDEYCEIQLYSSVILLLGRNSKGTQEYLVNKGRFFEYVHLSISPMRNHEDACTLCMLEKNYEKIKNYSATNRIFLSSKDTLKSHRLTRALDITSLPAPSENEQLRVIISHVLTRRLNNQCVFAKSNGPVNKENVDQLVDVLRGMWKTFPGLLQGCCEEMEDIQPVFSPNEVRVAMIKVITRPFFSFHIRQKQAAFKFCFEIMERLLNKKHVSKEEKEILKALVAGLADMNANYLIRQVNMERILKLLDKESYYKSVKALTTLSQGDTKSLFLEALLTNGNERGFFKETGETSQLKISFSDWLSLYLENNQVLLRGLEKWKSLQDTNHEYNYGLENFRSFFNYNKITKEEQEDICRNYHHMISLLPPDHMKKKEQRNDDPGYHVDFKKIEDGLCDLLGGRRVIMFVKDFGKNWSEIETTDRYILLNSNSEGQSQQFYILETQKRIENMLSGNNAKVIEIENTLYIPKVEHEHIVEPDKFFYLIKFIGGDRNRQELYFMCPAVENLEDEWNKDQRLNDMLPFLFRVKVLLTLRRYFERLICDHFEHIITLVHNEQVNKALSIAKASTHGNNEIMQRVSADNDILEKLYEDDSNNSTSQFKSLYDKHMQILAHNFITEVYRKINTGELKNNPIRQEVWIMDDRAFDTYEYRIFVYNSIKCAGKRKPSYSFMAPNQNGYPIEVTVCLDMKPKSSWILNYLLRPGISDSPNFKIIILLACNAAYHIEKGTEVQVNVYKDKRDYLCIENTWKENTDEQKKKAEGALEKLKEQLQIHPSRRKENDGISLWSLKRYCDLVAKGSKESFLITYEEHDGKLWFVVKMKLFYSGK